MDLIIFILIVYGLTNIIVNESVLRKPIDWLKTKSTFLEKVLSCMTCASWYIGILIYTIINIPITDIYLVDMLLMGILGSGSVNIIEHIKLKMEI
jgi:hypothetical protein